MNRLLKLEFRRLSQAKSFYICLAISLVLILISAITSKILYSAVQKMTAEDAESLAQLGAAALQKPTGLSLMKEIGSSSLTLILAIFLSIFVTEEYAGDVIKNVYAKGYSRDVVFFSKYICSLVATLVIVAVDAVFSLVLGKLLFGTIGKAGLHYASSFIALVFVLIGYHTLYFAIAITLRKTGSSIAISILGPLVISLLLTLGNAVIKSNKIDLSDYWISERLSVLEGANVATKEVWLSFLVAAVVILAAGAIGFFLNRKRES